MRILLLILILISQPIESGWYVVGAGIQPGIYYTIGDDCTVIVYSDYWTESRGWHFVGGWGMVGFYPSDYAISTTCPLVEYKGVESLWL